MARDVDNSRAPSSAKARVYLLSFFFFFNLYWMKRFPFFYFKKCPIFQKFLIRVEKLHYII